MKYPYIIFYRFEKFASVDNFFIENNEKLDCSLFFTSDKEDINKLDFSLMFAITVHKSQGRSVENITFIIDKDNLTEDRLTLITFFKELKFDGLKYPITEMRRIQ